MLTSSKYIEHTGVNYHQNGNKFVILLYRIIIKIYNLITNVVLYEKN